MAKTEVFRVNSRVFISHAYPVGYALDLLATLASALARPLSRILRVEITGGLDSVARALPELRSVGAEQMLELLPAIEAAGGSRLCVKILAHTWYEDAPINTEARLNEVFSEPGEGLMDMLILCWEVLAWNLSPLVRSIQARAQRSKSEAPSPL